MTFEQRLEGSKGMIMQIPGRWGARFREREQPLQRHLCVAVVTNYYKLSGLKQPKLIIFQIWRSEMILLG